METPVALFVTPMNAPHKDIDYLPLADKDFQIRNLSSDKNHLKVFCQVRNQYLSGLDILGLWESNLPKYFLPSVHVFPDLIHQCHANYDPNLRAVMSPSQTVLFPITTASTNEMLQFSPEQALTSLSMGYLLEKSSQFSQSELTRIYQMFMEPKHQPKGPPPYLQAFFTDIGKIIVDRIALIMGFNSSEYVDDITLVLLSIFTPGQPPIVKYDYASYIANKIHDQFLRLDNEGVFRYTTFIYHLMLYYQLKNFPFPMRKLDNKGNLRSVTFWSPIFHASYESPYSYSEFIDQFFHPATTLLIGVSPPRINGDIKRILQLSKQYRIGDWYLYENHTEIRIYGCELCPFKLPKYVPMRLFALEYFKQMIHIDQVHFCKAKKKAQLRIKNQLGPYVCNDREAWKEAEKILEDHLKLRKSFG